MRASGLITVVVLVDITGRLVSLDMEEGFGTRKLGA
jgi:hypothetical protein